MTGSRRMGRREFLQLGAMAGLGAVLASCAPAEPEVREVTRIVEKPGEDVEVVVTATPVPAVEGAAVEILGAGGVVLNQWDGIGAADGLVLTELLKGFAQENPEISVKRQIMPWNTFFDKLASALVAGAGGPDVFVLWHSVVPQYAKPGHLYPAAQDMFDRGMLPQDDFLPQLIDAVTIEGTAWTMPLDNYGAGVYLNLDVFDKAGVDPNAPPQNQTEFVEIARALTWDAAGRHPGEGGFDPDNIEVWGYHTGWPRLTFQAAYPQWGAGVISQDDPPEVLVDSEGAKAATQFYADLIFKEHVAPLPAGYDADTAFANGKLAMLPDGSWRYNWFTLFPDVNPSMWPYPRIGPERGATIMWSHTFAVSKDVKGEELEAALKLLQYLSDHSDTWNRKAGMPAARLSKREGLMEQVWTLPIFDKQFREEGVMEFSSDRFSEILGACEPEWSAILNNDKSVTEGLEAAGNRIRQILGS